MNTFGSVTRAIDGTNQRGTGITTMVAALVGHPEYGCGVLITAGPGEAFVRLAPDAFQHYRRVEADRVELLESLAVQWESQILVKSRREKAIKPTECDPEETLGEVYGDPNDTAPEAFPTVR